MRSVIACAALLLAASPSAWAQSRSPVTGPRTLRPHQISCTDLPAATLPAAVLVIKGGHNLDGHQNFTHGDVVVVGRTPDDGLAVGQRFAARRLQGGPARFPRTGEGFGKVRTAGWLTVTAVDDTNALATVEFACDAIEPGDYLEPFTEVVLPTAADAMGEPQFAERAQILFGADGRLTFGDGDTFSIDRGMTQGVAVGARFAIYRDHHDGIPLVYLGDAVVMEAGELTSKVVLVIAKDVVEAGDVAIPRRMP